MRVGLMPRLYILEVPENRSILELTARDLSLTIDRVGPYSRIDSAEPIVIDRVAAGCRHAVWYSAVSGIENSRITQFDKNALRVETR